MTKRFVKQFKMTHDIFEKVSFFTETTAPKWLTSEDTVKGSTMDDRWFWEDHILTLSIGGKANTDFNTIERIEDTIE